MTAEPTNQMQVLLEDEQQMHVFGEKIAHAIRQIHAPLLILLNHPGNAGQAFHFHDRPPLRWTHWSTLGLWNLKYVHRRIARACLMS